jgi:hypothetical protein
VLADAGVNLDFSWPILQNSNLGELNEFEKGFYRSPWCFPAVALHHLKPSEIKDLWEFESKRWRVCSPPFPSLLFTRSNPTSNIEQQTHPAT